MKTVAFNYSFKWIVVPQLIACGGGVLLCILGGMIWFPLIFLGLVPLGYGCFRYLEWNSTVYTLTSKYICKRTGIVFEKREQIPVSKILEKKLIVYIKREADMGSILLETAAQSANNSKSLEGDLIIANVEQVTSIYDAISGLTMIQN